MTKKYIEPTNPLALVDNEIYREIIKYPISFNEIIEAELRSQNEINDACDPIKNSYYYLTIPKNDSTEWGCKYENEFRRRMNRYGEKYMLAFEPGDHNSGEDLTCNIHQWSIEHKTTQSSSFYNTNSRSRKKESTKYNDPNKKVYYVLVKHKITNLNNGGAKTSINAIYFGMLSKNDWKNPNGSGAAYLKNDKIKSNFIQIYDSKIGNTLEYYQNWLDNEYYEKMIELENETKN